MAWIRSHKKSGGSPINYEIEQGQTTSTSTTTASLTEGKCYLFNTVYGDSAFSGAKIMVGDTKPIFTATGIGRTGCIIKATSNTVTYSRSGNVSANEYTEIDVIPDADIGGMGDSWNSETAINSTKDDLYFLTLGDGETGNIVGADILVEHELLDTVSNGTRFLIVKATGNSIALDNSHSFYYRQIGIIGGGGSGGVTILSGVTDPTSSQGVDGQIYLKYSDKEKLINSSRGSYINTGYVMNNNTVFEMKCKITGGGAWPVPFGARDVNSNNAGAKEWMVQIYGGYFRYDADIGLTNGPASSKYMNREITMRLGNNKFYISSDDDTDEYTFTQGNPTTKPMFVFGLDAVGSYSYPDSSAYMELYSFTIYEGDTIVHNFVPAYNNNQWCLYDEIDETYFYKLGSGSEFTGLEKDLIDEVKLKVNGAWQDLVNSDIDDVNLGN